MPESLIKCKSCGKVIGEIENLKDGKITIICRNSRCKATNIIEVRPPKKYIQNAPYQNRMDLVRKS
jgi:hypothetical protein